MSNIIIPIITGIVCLAVGVIIGFLYRKSVAEKEIGSAETEATRIINEAIKAGISCCNENVWRWSCIGASAYSGNWRCASISS